jgi:hypothetical protein
VNSRNLFRRALWMWLVLLVAIVAVGTLRQALLEPRLGEPAAHRLGTVAAAVVAALLIGWFIRRQRPAPAAALGVGALWVVMTVAFEFGFFAGVMGHPLEELLVDWNVFRGRLFPVLLLTVLLAPWLWARTLARKT